MEAAADRGLHPALLTPLILWKMPTDFLPILLGDYLTLHFLLYGALTTIALLYLRKDRSPDAAAPVSWKAIAIAAAAVAAYNIVAFGLPIDTYVFSFLPISAADSSDSRDCLRNPALFHRR